MSSRPCRPPGPCRCRWWRAGTFSGGSRCSSAAPVGTCSWWLGCRVQAIQLYTILRGELKPKPESIFLIFMFSLLGPCWCGRTVCCALCMIRRHRKLILEVYTSGRHCPFFNSSGVIIFPTNSLFLLRQRSKSSPTLPEVRGGVKKTQNAFFTVFHHKIAIRSTATSSKRMVSNVSDYMKSVSWCRRRRVSNWNGEPVGGRKREWGGEGEGEVSLQAT